MTISTRRSVSPSTGDSAIARTAREALADYARQGRSLKLRIAESAEDQPIELPASVVTLLVDVLAAVAAGSDVAIVPRKTELTTVEAADLLNVSRPFLIRLLDAGAIPHRKVGTHRRIQLEDVLAYKDRDDQEREAVLDQLVREAQEQDMGYPRQ